MTARSRAERRARLSEAIDRLAALIEDGELLAAADPAALLHAAADLIERRRPDWRPDEPTAAERDAHGGPWLVRWPDGAIGAVIWSAATDCWRWIAEAPRQPWRGAEWAPCDADLQAIRRQIETPPPRRGDGAGEEVTR